MILRVGGVREEGHEVLSCEEEPDCLEDKS